MLYDRLEALTEPKAWLELALNIGRRHIQRSEATPEALKLARTVLQKVREGKFENFLAAALNNLASLLFQANLIHEALEPLLEARILLDMVAASTEKRRTYNLLGGVHQLSGNFSEAFLDYQQALQVTRELQDQVGEARLLNNMAFMLQQQHKFADALEMFDHAEQLWRELQQHADLSRVLVNKAGVLLEEMDAGKTDPQRLEQGMAFLAEAQDLLETHSNPALQASALDHAARFSLKRGRLDVAQQQATQARALSEAQGNQEALAFLEVTFGDIAVAQQNSPVALKHFELAHQLFADIGFKDNLLQVLDRLYKTHRNAGDAGQALHFLEQLYRLDREIRSEHASKQLEVLAHQRKTEKIQHEAELERIRRTELEQLVLERSSEIEALLEKKRNLEEANQHMRELSERDGLTGVYNRRYLNEHCERAFQHALQQEQPLMAIILDIDSFKKINDTLSHQAGDEVLKKLAAILVQTVRTSDVVARYGGEEFVVVMPQTQLQHAEMVAERIRSGVENHPWHVLYPDLRVTISLGLASNLGMADHEQMIHAADEALYVSKHTGKNRVTVSPHALGVQPDQGQ